MSPDAVIIIQARMGSTRLPGKILKHIATKPMLEWVVDRAHRAKLAGKVVVATTILEEDDVVERWCADYPVCCYRGSASDVLGRYAGAVLQLEFRPQIVVRLTADCPFTDPSVIDRCIELLVGDEAAGYVASRRPNGRTYPVGIDVEAFRASLLLTASQQAHQEYQREHVTPWFYDGSYSGKLAFVDADNDFSRERWTVDTYEDLAFARSVAPYLHTDSWADLIKVVSDRPDIRALNTHVRQKGYKDVS